MVLCSHHEYLICNCIHLAGFLKTNLTKFAVISVKERQKAGFLSPRSPKIIVTKEKERRRRKKKAMVVLLVFIIFTLEIVFGKKKLFGAKGLFAITLSKIPARHVCSCWKCERSVKLWLCKTVDCLRPKRKRVRSILRNPLLVSSLYSGTHILPQFSSGYLKKGRVHIIAKVMLYSGTVPGQQVWTLLKQYMFFFQYIAFKKMTRAALIIQNQYRTHREHERFKKSRRAAAIIQNTFRSYRERRRSTQRRREQRLSKRQEARYIQKASNRYLYRFEFQGRI